MNSVLVATNNTQEAFKLKRFLVKEFSISFINKPDANDYDLSKTDLVLLDHEFTEHSGIDFLMLILQKAYVPVLMLTPPEDSQCAIEAKRVGAYNYVVKTEGYYQILNHLIREAIDTFGEQAQMKQTIIDLKTEVNELKRRLGINEKDNSSGTPVAKINIVNEIASRLRRGEINLPSLPQIGNRFKKLINTGANLKDVADLLKQDVAISSKLISLSNSVRYRGVAENKTIEQAINRLGLATTKHYVEVINNRAIYVTSNKKYVELINVLWKHSLSCAYASQITAELIKLKSPDIIFVMGLFHDIGKSMLLQVISELEKDKMFVGKIDMKSVQKTLNQYHNKFGASLLKQWGYSESHIDIVRYNEHVEEADPISKELLVISFANLLVKSMGYTDEPQEGTDLENAYVVKLLKINPEMIADIETTVTKRLSELSGIIV